MCSVNREHLITKFEQMNDYFTLDGLYGRQHGKAGDYIATNINGDKFVVLGCSKNKLVQVRLSRLEIDKNEYIVGLKEMAGEYEYL